MNYEIETSFGLAGQPTLETLLDEDFSAKDESFHNPGIGFPSFAGSNESYIIYNDNMFLCDINDHNRTDSHADRQTDNAEKQTGEAGRQTNDAEKQTNGVEQKINEVEKQTNDSDLLVNGCE